MFAEVENVVGEIAFCCSAVFVFLAVLHDEVIPLVSLLNRKDKKSSMRKGRHFFSVEKTRKFSIK